MGWRHRSGRYLYRSGLDVGILDKLADQVDPTKTLLYLNQWRKDDLMLIFQIIQQNLSLVVLLKLARQYGFRVMPHVNLVGVMPYHPLYTEVQKFQYRNPWIWESYGLVLGSNG